MFKFIVDIFFKDTIVGLSQLGDYRYKRIYKNRQQRLFSQQYLNNRRPKFIDPIACRL